MAIASKLAIAIFLYIHPPTSTTSPQSRGLTKFQNKVNAALRISQIEPYAGEFERAVGLGVGAIRARLCSPTV